MKGLLFGSLASMLNFQLLSKRIEQLTLAQNIADKKKSIGGMLKNYYLRLAVIIAVLVGAMVKKDEINIITTIIGLFSIQLSIFLINFFDTIKSKKN